MDRRDFLVLWLQALLLSLFPWLRTSRGVEVAGQLAESMAPGILQPEILASGFWMRIYVEPEAWVLGARNGRGGDW